MVQGDRDDDLASLRGGSVILLFAFTYLWVAANGFLSAGGRAFGRYCLFVAITAIPAAISTRLTTRTATTPRATSELGGPLVSVLLALALPIARITGILAIAEGIGTA
jgi:hypothetical protein